MGRTTNPPAGTVGVREALKGWGRRLAKPQRQAGALTADVLAVIRLTARETPCRRGRGLETAELGRPERGRFDVALVAVAVRRRIAAQSEASSLTWCPGGTLQRWDDGSGRITVIRSKTDVEAARAPWWPSFPPRLTLLTRYGRRALASRCESVRVVGVPDRPAGEGDRQGRGV